jgi:hypothetical protein
MGVQEFLKTVAAHLEPPSGSAKQVADP